ALHTEFPAAVLWDTLSQRGLLGLVATALLRISGPPASRPGALGRVCARIVCGSLVLKAQPGRRALAGLGAFRPTRGLPWIARGLPMLCLGNRLRRPVRGKRGCPAIQRGRTFHGLRHWLGAVPLGGSI